MQPILGNIAALSVIEQFGEAGPPGDSIMLDDGVTELFLDDGFTPLFLDGSS